MNENRTDKQILVKGFQNLGISLILMFLGPTIIYLALSNKEKPLYVPLLVIGIIGCAAAVYFAFRGINKILDSMFKNNSSS
jgi:molybdopterin/thiamine biosynthesis adenylyltransferase